MVDFIRLTLKTEVSEAGSTRLQAALTFLVSFYFFAILLSIY